MAFWIFFLWSPDCPKRPKIENSYWKCVLRDICSLICGDIYVLKLPLCAITAKNKLINWDRLSCNPMANPSNTEWNERAIRRIKDLKVEWWNTPSIWVWSWSWSCCPSGFSANIGFSMLVMGGRDSVLAEYLNLDSAPFSEWPFPSNGEFSSLTLKREFSLKYDSNCQLIGISTSFKNISLI